MAEQTLLYEKKPPQQAQYVAKETRLDHFFDALAGKLDVIIISSDAVKKKKISGTFDLSDPQAALSQMLKTMALVSYRENRTLYIYSSNEVESSMLTLNAVTRNELTTFLKQTGLFDAQYPLTSDRQQRILYVTAPPRYLALIRSAADALEAQYSVQEQGITQEDEHIQLVKLEHSFVQDQEITSRGKSLILPEWRPHCGSYWIPDLRQKPDWYRRMLDRTIFSRLKLSGWAVSGCGLCRCRGKTACC